MLGISLVIGTLAKGSAHQILKLAWKAQSDGLKMVDPKRAQCHSLALSNTTQETGLHSCFMCNTNDKMLIRHLTVILKHWWFHQSTRGCHHYKHFHVHRPHFPITEVKYADENETILTSTIGHSIRYRTIVFFSFYLEHFPTIKYGKYFTSAKEERLGSEERLQCNFTL